MGTPLGEGGSYKNTYIKPFNGKYLENEYKKATEHKKGNMHSTLTAIQNSISHSTQLGGDEKDLIKTWKWAYYKMGWQKLQHFNPQGHLSHIYNLHKHKHWQKPDGQKIHKGRVIAPCWPPSPNA